MNLKYKALIAYPSVSLSKLRLGELDKRRRQFYALWPYGYFVNVFFNVFNFLIPPFLFFSLSLSLLFRRHHLPRTSQNRRKKSTKLSLKWHIHKRKNTYLHNTTRWNYVKTKASKHLFYMSTQCDLLCQYCLYKKFDTFDKYCSLFMIWIFE